MTQKILDALEYVVFVIFILGCIFLMVGTLAQHGCLPEIKRKPVVLVKEKASSTEKKQTNLTLHWAAVKAERTR